MRNRGLAMLGVLGAVGLLVHALGPVGTTEGSTEENPKPVQVMNDAATPVPTTIVGGAAVSGTVGAAQSGAWNVGAAQSGPWNVAVTNLPAVQPVALTPPNLASGRLQFLIDSFSEQQDLVVPAGAVMTDLVATPKHFGDSVCLMTIYAGAPTAENLIFDLVPRTHELFTLHLETGYRGPLTIRFEAAGLDPARCTGEIFWTGYILP